jgi:hypothetical protein
MDPAWEQYLHDLRTLHKASGERSARRIAQLTDDRLSADEIDSYLDGVLVPAWPKLERLIWTLNGGDKEEKIFAEHWKRLTPRSQWKSGKDQPPRMAPGESAILGELQAIRALLEKIVNSER